MSDELNLRAGVFALALLGVCFASIASMLWVTPLIAFTLVLVSFTLFATITLMNAKTTGGPVG
jgi:uncharacterized membrane protein